MKLIIGGVRGTNTVAQPDFVKYGGETTSLLIESQAGGRILIDAGTGIRSLGARLAEDPGSRSVLLLITHYHLDHIVGLPSLGLLYDKEWRIKIAAQKHQEFDVESIMRRIMDKPFWPLQVSDLAASIQFESLPAAANGSPLRWDGLEIRWCPLHHPGGCTAYRIDEPATGASLVFATDVEWAESSEEEQSLLRALCVQPKPADLLLMDAQYEASEYEKFRGWGHSTWEEGLALATSLGIPRLRLIHHDPQKNDEALDRLNAEITTQAPFASLARSSEELNLSS
ncbi:MAG: MBL fold metallo-hydrolase [Kiritimatiellae bacterium]|nr:MBL fold metallo-hydrolase [Kiritimatiellia bacterium]